MFVIDEDFILYENNADQRLESLLLGNPQQRQ